MSNKLTKKRKEYIGDFTINGNTYKVYVCGKKLIEGSLGRCYLKEKTIYIVYRFWVDDKHFSKLTNEMIKALWHEIGHVIEHNMPTSIMEGEWVSVAFETLCVNHSQIKKLEQKIKQIDWNKEEVMQVKKLLS